MNSEFLYEKKNKLIIMIVIIAVAAAMTVLGVILLPETIGMQIGTGGTLNNFASKYVGLLLPVGLSTVFAVLYYRQTERNLKNLFVSLIGILCFVLIFIFNL